MMKKYFVHTSTDRQGDHEVHSEGCSFMPSASNRIYLGEYSNCWEAVAAAKNKFSQVNGCYYCCNECHTQ